MPKATLTEIEARKGAIVEAAVIVRHQGGDLIKLADTIANFVLHGTVPNKPVAPKGKKR